MSISKSLIISALFVTIFSSCSFADIYRYTAANGKIYYTDKPKSAKYKRIIVTKKKKSKSSKKGFAKYLKLKKAKYSPIIQSMAAKYQVDPKLIHAVIQVESAYNHKAISPAGALGLMQLMPSTATRYGVNNPHDPDQNIDGGIRYLKDLLAMFKSNLSLALAAYNAGENAVIKYHNSIPPFPETQAYVKKVLRLYQG